MVLRSVRYLFAVVALAAGFGIAGSPLLRAEESATATEQATGEKLLPQETVLYFSMPDAAEFREHWEKSTGGSLLADPAMQPMIKEIESKLAEASEKLQSEVGLSISDLLALPQGEVSFALLQKPVGKLAPTILFDFGEHKDKVEKLLEKMHEAMAKGNIEHETQSIQDVEVHVFDLPKTMGDEDEPQPNPFSNLCYFVEGNYLVLSTEVAAIESIIERWDGDSNETFADHRTWKYILEKTAGSEHEPLTKFFIDPMGLVQSGVQLAQQQNPQAAMVLGFLPVLGLDKFKGIGGAGSIAVGDYDSIGRTFIYCEQPPTGLLNLFQCPETDTTPPKFVPADVTWYWNVNWAIQDAYKAVEQLFDSFSGPGALARTVDDLSTNEDGPHLHIKKDIIDLMTGKLHFAQAPGESNAENPVGNLLVAIELKDAARMQKSLAKAAKSDAAPVKSREFNGVTIYEVGDEDSDQKMVAAVANDHLMVTNQPQILEGALRSERTASSLADNPKFKALAKHLPAKSCSIAFQDAESSAKLGYEMLRSQNPEQTMGVDLSKLPEFSVISKYMRAQLGYMQPDKKGALLTVFSLSEDDK